MVQKEMHTKVAMTSTGDGNEYYFQAPKYVKIKSSCKIRCAVDVHTIFSYSVIDL